jgi:hypothetical protein
VAKVVLTGEAAPADEPETEAPLAKPVLVWICEGGPEPDKCEEVVFKADKVALAAKAFRSVRITHEDAESDPLLKGKGKETPRVLVIDTERKVTVLEKSKLTASSVFDAMKKVVKDTWKEDVEAKVKAQLKILTETDKLSAEEQQLSEKESRISSDDAAARKDLAEIKKEKEELRTKREELATQTRDLWAFVAKKPDAAPKD